MADSIAGRVAAAVAVGELVVAVVVPVANHRVETEGGLESCSKSVGC